MQTLHEEKILILAKTYPTLSEKYLETVCTAGIREDGTWVRIYPVRFRQMSEVERYQKYQWITCDVYKPEMKNDRRHESYHVEGGIRIGPAISTKDSWSERRKVVLGRTKIYTNKHELIGASRNFATSLAIFKPTRIEGPFAEVDEREWDQVKLKRALGKARQLDLFEEASRQFTIVKKLPYKFHYTVYDDDGAESHHVILDWEIGSLFWGEVKRLGTEEAAKDSVIKKFASFCNLDKYDTHFYMGTSKEFQQKNAPNPWMIIGVGYFPKMTLVKNIPEQLMLNI